MKLFDGYATADSGDKTPLNFSSPQSGASEIHESAEEDILQSTMSSTDPDVLEIDANEDLDAEPVFQS